MRAKAISLLAVGLGGALGTGLRYGFSVAALGLDPVIAVLSTLAANVLGAGLIGYLSTRRLGEGAKALWMTGFCGGFTTFSFFSLEILLLFDRSAALALGYGALLRWAMAPCRWSCGCWPSGRAWRWAAKAPPRGPHPPAHDPLGGACPLRGRRVRYCRPVASP